MARTNQRQPCHGQSSDCDMGACTLRNAAEATGPALQHGDAKRQPNHEPEGPARRSARPPVDNPPPARRQPPPVAPPPTRHPQTRAPIARPHGRCGARFAGADGAHRSTIPARFLGDSALHFLAASRPPGVTSTKRARILRSGLPNERNAIAPAHASRPGRDGGARRQAW